MIKHERLCVRRPTAKNRRASLFTPPVMGALWQLQYIYYPLIMDFMIWASSLHIYVKSVLKVNLCSSHALLCRNIPQYVYAQEWHLLAWLKPQRTSSASLIIVVKAKSDDIMFSINAAENWHHCICQLHRFPADSERSMYQTLLGCTI